MTNLHTPTVLLKGKLIELISFTANDITCKHIEWLNDQVTTKFSNQRFLHHTYESCSSYLNSFYNTENLYLSIKRLDNKSSIGTITAFKNLNHGVCDIGILIGCSDSRGLGLGKEAFLILINHIKSDKRVKKITCGTLSTNEPMIGLAKSLGMIPDGTRCKHEIYDNKMVDVNYFALFIDDFTKP
jgi:ribosomal-protein-alanine N-acetyltransferase